MMKKVLWTIVISFLSFIGIAVSISAAKVQGIDNHTKTCLCAVAALHAYMLIFFIVELINEVVNAIKKKRKEKQLNK